MWNMIKKSDATENSVFLVFSVAVLVPYRYCPKTSASLNFSDWSNYDWWPQTYSRNFMYVEPSDSEVLTNVQGDPQGSLILTFYEFLYVSVELTLVQRSWGWRRKRSQASRIR